MGSQQTMHMQMPQMMFPIPTAQQQLPQMQPSSQPNSQAQQQGQQPSPQPSHQAWQQTLQCASPHHQQLPQQHQQQATQQQAPPSPGGLAMSPAHQGRMAIDSDISSPTHQEQIQTPPKITAPNSVRRNGKEYPSVAAQNA